MRIRSTHIWQSHRAAAQRVPAAKPIPAQPIPAAKPILVAGFLPAAFTLILLVLVACGAGMTATAAPAHAFNQEVTRQAKVVRLKAFQHRFGTAPQLLILGSSRAMRADPAQLRKALGIKGFNASVSSGTIPDAYAFFELTKRHYPAARPAVLWLLDVEVLRLSGYHPYLLSVPPLMRCLPKGGPGRPGARPQSLPWNLAKGGARGGRVVRPRFHADGLMTFWWHDLQRASGRGTMAGVRYQKTGYSAIYTGRGWSGLTGSAKWFATEIVKQANAMGVTPVIVLTPYHPALRRYIAGRGWNKAYREVRRFLRQLNERFDLKLVDLTSLRSFGGWPNGFYDGVHPRRPMMRAMLRRVIRKARPYLVPGGAAPSSSSSTAASTSSAAASPASTAPASSSAAAAQVDPGSIGTPLAGSPTMSPSPPAADPTLVPFAPATPFPGATPFSAEGAGATAVRSKGPWIGAPSALPSAWPTPPRISVI